MKTKSTIFHRKLMIKTASLIVLSIIICACSTNNKSLLSGIEIIPVEVDEVSQDVSLFLEKIEIVPLETNDSSIFHRGTNSETNINNKSCIRNKWHSHSFLYIV